ncbi:hypothetical protein LEL_08773 [Akanthomyces lecanii RCEF 1005]|uniref:Uncharacterized protein n=1 Tax=Akanthomyces lecanii RCEF 1005 TaxID=1081108 RepID=A0A162MZB4_CORDF|nr:hypothetical protein LEL_08773 [Akanthomyces lecanii RCEF 1005]
MDEFKAEYDSYLAQVSVWRKKKRLLVLAGMGSKTEPVAFEKACRAQFSHPYAAEFLWMPNKKARRKHQGKVAVGFDDPSQREAAVPNLLRWTWKNHQIQIEGMSYKKYLNGLPAGQAAPKKSTQNRPLPSTQQNTFQPLKKPQAHRIVPQNTAATVATAAPFSASVAPPKQVGDPSPTTNIQPKTRALQIMAVPKSPFVIDPIGDSYLEPTCSVPNCVVTAVNVPRAAAAAVHEAAGIAAVTAAAAQTAVDEAQAATFRAFNAETRGDLVAAAAAKEDAAAADERARTAYGAAATAARLAAAYSGSISLRVIRYQY